MEMFYDRHQKLKEPIAECSTCGRNIYSIKEFLNETFLLEFRHNGMCTKCQQKLYYK